MKRKVVLSFVAGAVLGAGVVFWHEHIRQDQWVIESYGPHNMILRRHNTRTGETWTKVANSDWEKLTPPRKSKVTFLD